MRTRTESGRSESKEANFSSSVTEERYSTSTTRNQARNHVEIIGLQILYSLDLLRATNPRIPTGNCQKVSHPFDFYPITLCLQTDKYIITNKSICYSKFALKLSVSS